MAVEAVSKRLANLGWRPVITVRVGEIAEVSAGPEAGPLAQVLEAFLSSSGTARSRLSTDPSRRQDPSVNFTGPGLRQRFMQMDDFRNHVPRHLLVTEVQERRFGEGRGILGNQMQGDDGARDVVRFSDCGYFANQSGRQDQLLDFVRAYAEALKS